MTGNTIHGNRHQLTTASASHGVEGAARRPIVVVEDDPNDEALLRRAFKKNELRHPVVVLRDGAEALEYFQKRDRYAHRDCDESPLVVLLDLNLPKIDGMAVLEELRSNEETQKLPVVVLTSSDERTDRARSYDLGANSYVCKPVEFTEFCDAVGTVGHYWSTLNRPPE